MNLGNHLFHARKKCGFSQEDVAEKLGVSRQTVSKWETGRGLPEIKLPALSEALTVFAEEILSPVYIGWVTGYLDEERAKVEAYANSEPRIQICHPRAAYQSLIKDLNANPQWLD